MVQLKYILLCALCVLACTVAYASDRYDFELTVLDEFDQPLIGAFVYTDDQSFSSTTDIDGRVILADLAYNSQVNISYLGYRTRSLPFYEIRKLGGIVRLRPDENIISEFIIVGRRDEPLETMPHHVERISAREIAFYNPPTAADLLTANGGVFIQKSQMGGGSPVIRGFEANRILLVVDGVRLNNAIYRSGHLQNSITIDPASLEQAEVIYGPGSLTYGSDALGGVVHYRTQDPKLFTGDAVAGREYNNSSSGYIRFASANFEKRIHADVNFGRRKWGSFTSFSLVDFDNLRSGRNRPEGFEQFGRREIYAFRQNNIDQFIRDTSEFNNVQFGTEYTQLDFLQKVKFQPSDYFYAVANLQFSTTSDVPRYDQLTEIKNGKPKFTEWYYGPQRRLLFSTKFRFLKENALFDRLTVIPSYQKIDEDRVQRKWQQIEREKSLVDVQVFSLTADFEKHLDADTRHQLAYGLDASVNQVDSEAFIEYTSRQRGISFNVLPRYPAGGNQTRSFGGYVNHRWQTPDSLLTTNVGVRYTHNYLSARFQEGRPVVWPQNFIDGLELNNQALTWGVGATLNTPDQWQLRVLAATAFRSPNIDDWVKIREKSGNITIPNQSIEPERSLSFETTIGKRIGTAAGPNLYLSGTGFYTRLTDALVREVLPVPGTEQTFLILPPNDTLRTLGNVNAARGRVYGLSGNLRAELGNGWELSGNLTWTKGQRSLEKTFDQEDPIMRVDTLVPLDHIPPLYATAELSYRADKLRLAARINHNGAKTIDDYSVTDAFVLNDGTLLFDRDGTSDNFDQSYYHVGEDGKRTHVGTLAWTTFNFYSSYQLSDRFALDLAVENIADLHYRPFASGVSAPGRNFILTLRGEF